VLREGSVDKGQDEGDSRCSICEEMSWDSQIFAKPGGFVGMERCNARKPENERKDYIPR
jgi:hypothetical protein